MIITPQALAALVPDIPTFLIRGHPDCPVETTHQAPKTAPTSGWVCTGATSPAQRAQTAHHEDEAVLGALRGHKPRSVSKIAADAGLGVGETRKALKRLVKAGRANRASKRTYKEG